MSLGNDFIDFEFPLPDSHGLQDVTCEQIGCGLGELLTVTKDGQLNGYQDRRLDKKGAPTLTGEVYLYNRANKNSEFYFYTARFQNNQLQSIMRRNFLSVEFSGFTLEQPQTKFYCQYLAKYNCETYRLTKDGRLFGSKLKRPTELQFFDPNSFLYSKELNFHGDLKFFSTVGNTVNNDKGRWQFLDPVDITTVKSYVAHFQSGQLQTIEEIEEERLIENK